MLCSTIIPTVGRATLSRAVCSILEQDPGDGEFEVIVVNDSGVPLIVADWMQSPKVRLLHTNRRERSVARNAGAAVARGRFLHFLDDDDWLAPDALRNLWTLSQSSQAKWLYGITQLVDRDGAPIIRLQHNLNGNCFIQVMAGEWIPLQASIIDAPTFFAVGGFSPTLCGPEDIDLLRRIALVAEIAETPQLVAYVARGEAGSTTDYAIHRQAGRRAREKILNSPLAFCTMRASARAPEWQGYTARIYLTSLLLNLWRRRPLSAASRAMYGLMGFLSAGPSLFSREFWRAVAKPYESVTFRRGFREAALASAS